MTDRQETAVRRWVDANWRKYVKRDSQGRPVEASFEALADACIEQLRWTEAAAEDPLLRPEIIAAAKKAVPHVAS
jgi:hypothetical protein